ncbi:hypothetical protein LX88_008356 [Lentzea californiensis]|nr:hypothetical protein [Lentzea californiensis]
MPRAPRHRRRPTAATHWHRCGRGPDRRRRTSARRPALARAAPASRRWHAAGSARHTSTSGRRSGRPWSAPRICPNGRSAASVTVAGSPRHPAVARDRARRPRSRAGIGPRGCPPAAPSPCRAARGPRGARRGCPVRDPPGHRPGSRPGRHPVPGALAATGPRARPQHRWRHPGHVHPLRSTLPSRSLVRWGTTVARFWFPSGGMPQWQEAWQARRFAIPSTSRCASPAAQRRRLISPLAR